MTEEQTSYIPQTIDVPLNDGIQYSFKERSEKIDKLCQKIVEIMKSTKAIGKHGYNEKQEYSYTEASDVFSIVRDAMSAQNVVIFPSMLSKEVVTRKNPNGKDIMVTQVTMAYSIVDVDSSQYVRVVYSGEGMDSGDKGMPKALSVCLKYYLRDQFLIPFGDDPEDEKPASTEKKKQTTSAKKEPEPKQNGKTIQEYQDTVQYIMTNKLGYTEPEEQYRILNFLLGTEDIVSFTSLDRDQIFRFYTVIDNLLGRKIERGQHRTEEDYKVIREKIDGLLKSGEVEE